MRTLRGVLVSAIIVTLGVVVVPTPAMAAPPSAPYTAFHVDGGISSETSPWLKGSHTFDDTNATISLTANTAEGWDHLVLRATSGQLIWEAEIESPDFTKFTTGTYQTAYQGGSSAATFRLFGDGRSCSPMPGTMTITELGRDAVTEVINVFAASFDLDCNGGHTTQPMAGELRWHSTVGYQAAETTPIDLHLGTVDIGQFGPAQPVTIKATGSVPVTFGAASIAGTTPAAFAVEANSCNGVTLAYGETCTVMVKARPTATGEQKAKVVVADNTVSGSKQAGLIVNGTTGATGTYYPLYPERLLDTRNGNGAPAGKVPGGGTVHLQVTGRGGVPATGVSAVVLNVTVTEPTTSGHITVHPGATPQPTASSLNFVPGWTGANSVTVAVGSNGQVDLYNSAGNTHLIADVMGFYASNNDVLPSRGLGGQLYMHTPVRMLDTREDFEGFKLPSGAYVRIPFGYAESIQPHVRAVVLNITAVDPDGPGYLTTWNGLAGQIPATSTLNYARGGVVPNLAIVPTSRCGSECSPYTEMPLMGVFTSQNTHVIVDVVGFLDDSYLDGGLRFKPNTPTRITDSRIGLGIPGKVGQAATATVTVPGTIADAATWALALNVTAVQPTENTFMTVWETGIAQPLVSNLNPFRGQIIPNAVISGINAEKRFNAYNNAGQTDLVIDVVGTYYFWEGASTFSAKFKGISPLRVPEEPAPQRQRVTWQY